MAGQEKSKWLRDEGDADWEVWISRDNSFPKSGESGYEHGGKQVIQKYSEIYDMHENTDLIQQKDMGP